MGHFIRLSILLSVAAVLWTAGVYTPALANPYANESYADDGLRDDAEDEQLSAADELYRDGLDSLQDNRPDLARKFFQYLLAHHPAAPSADKARRELAKLDKIEEAEARDLGRDDEDAAVPNAVAKAPAAIGPGVPEQGSVQVPARVSIEKPGQLPVRAAAKAARPPLPRSLTSISELSQVFTRVIGDRVFFADSSADLGGRARALINAQARWLLHRPNLSIAVMGHADDSGTASDNADLSLKRAEAVREQLIISGVQPERVKIQSLGSGAPVAVCASSQCQAQNRRAVSVLSLIDPLQPAIAEAPTASAHPGDSQPLEPTVPTIR